MVGIETSDDAAVYRLNDEVAMINTVDDEEPKYGLCVNGTVHPERVITNAGSLPGDALILTKPLGSGVLFNAVRSKKMPLKEVEQEMLPSLAALNGPAIETALHFGLRACTDITGFGILGHLLEVAHGANARVLLKQSALPFYSGALDMYKKGETTGSNKANRALVARHRLDMRASLSRHEEELLYDPQTSGGLLLSVPQDQADELVTALHRNGVHSAVRIGEVLDESAGITVE
jgi:selenide,water dikinase